MNYRLDSIKKKLKDIANSPTGAAISEKIVKASADIAGKAMEFREGISEEIRLHEQKEKEKKDEKLRIQKRKIEEDIRRQELKRQKRRIIVRRFKIFSSVSLAIVALLFGIVIYFAPPAQEISAQSPATTSIPAVAPLDGSRFDASLENSSTRAASSERVNQGPSDCIANGINYYREIGSFPTLSTGEDAQSKVISMCQRSNNVAFQRRSN